jgi:hypothetical protein
MRAKQIIGDFDEFFLRGSKLFGPPNCPERSAGQFGGQKSAGGRFRIRNHGIEL